MLNYKISGNGKETLVLLHGLMENIKVWNDMLPELEKYFNVIRIDLPGHGKSRLFAKVQTMELIALEVKKTLDYIGITKFHLLGHSMGGYASLAYANEFPKSLYSLTLFFSTYFPDSEKKKNIRKKSFRIIMKEEYNKYVNACIPNLFHPYKREKLRDKIEFAKTVALETKQEGVLASIKGIIERTDKRIVLEKLNTKILIITGLFDNIINNQQLIKNLPKKNNIKTYVLNCGHNGHLENPILSTEIIKTELL